MEIKDYRKKHRLSVINLSKLFGCTRQHLTLIETHKTYPSRKLAKKIEELTNNEITFTELMR